jgi:hypothetical protein
MKAARMPTNSATNSEKTYASLLWITAMLSVAVMFLAAQPYLHIMWDSVIYIQLAENLLQSGEYTYNGVRHIKYPPGFPMILAGVMALFGKSYYALRLQSALWGALLPPITFLLLQKGPKLPPLFCLLGGILCITDVSLAYTSTSILSDLPFCTCLMALFLCTAQLEWESLLATKSASPVPVAHWRVYVAALLCILLASIRVVSLALSFALLIKLLLPSTPKILRKQLAVLFICSATPTLLWLGYSATHAHTFPFDTIDHIGYFPEFMRPESAARSSSGLSFFDLAERIQNNISHLSPWILALAANHSSSLFTRLTLGILLIALFLLAQFHTRRYAPLPSLFLLSYLPMLLLWGAKQGYRFLLPTVPIAIFFAVIGAHRLYRHPTSLFRCLTTLVLVTLVCNRSLLLFSPLNLEIARPYYRSEQEQLWLKISEELASRLKASDRFMSEDAPVLSHLSGRWGIALPWPETTVESFSQRIATLGITHVVVTDSVPIQLRNCLLQANAQEIHKGSGYSIFHIQGSTRARAQHVDLATDIPTAQTAP